MLRGLKSNHLGGFFSACGPGTTGGAGYILSGGGQDNFSSVTRIETGSTDAVLNSERQFARAPVVVGGSIDATAGSYVIERVSTASLIKTAWKNASGSAGNAISCSLVLGWSSEETDHLPARYSVKGWEQSPRVLTAFVGASGACDCYSLSVVKSDTGVYTITYKNAFGRDYAMPVAVPVSHVQKSAYVTTVTKRGCVVKTFDISEAAEDNAFYLVVYGWDSLYHQSGVERVVQLPYRSPKIVGGVIDTDASILVGTGDFTVVKEATTGLWTIAFTDAFLGEPCVLTTGRTARCQLYESALTTGFQAYTSNAAGSAQDSVAWTFIAIGQDTNISYTSGDTGMGNGSAVSTDVTNT